MEGKGANSQTPFTSAINLTMSGATHVPERYVLPQPDRPHPIPCPSITTLPIIDLSSLHDSSSRSHVVDQIRSACKEIGSFQVSFSLNSMLTSISKVLIHCSFSINDN